MVTVPTHQSPVAVASRPWCGGTLGLNQACLIDCWVQKPGCGNLVPDDDCRSGAEIDAGLRSADWPAAGLGRPRQGCGAFAPRIANHEAWLRPHRDHPLGGVPLARSLLLVSVVFLPPAIQ